MDNIILIDIITPILLTIGIIAWMLKSYLHFFYLKIVKEYPQELSFWDFNSSIFSYFWDQQLTFFPIFIKSKRTDLDSEQQKKLSKLQKAIKTCLVLIYLGILALIIGIYFQK